jgi:hypothetical protein
MAAVPRRLKRMEVYCPEYETTATIRINDAHSSGTDHFEVDYRSPDHSHFTIAIPDDWTDQDLLELIFLPPRDPGKRNWPAWEIPAYDFVSFRLPIQFPRLSSQSTHLPSASGCSFRRQLRLPAVVWRRRDPFQCRIPD